MASSSEAWRTGVRKEGLPRPCLVPACRHTSVCPSALLAATQAGTGLAGAEERSRRERGDRPASSVWRGGKAEGTGHCALCPEAAQAETWPEPGSGAGAACSMRQVSPGATPPAQSLRQAGCPGAQRPPHPHPSPSERQAALASGEASLTTLAVGTWRSPWISSRRWTSWCS